MPVPAEIRAVPRPVNTVVVDTKSEGPTRWAVRERKAVLYVRGGNPQPRNGRVCGHIIDGVYVPVARRGPARAPEALAYGAAAFAEQGLSEIAADLAEAFGWMEANEILALAQVRAMRPDLSISRVEQAYRLSWARVHHPKADMSEQGLLRLLARLGRSPQRLAFEKRRLAALPPRSRMIVECAVRRARTQTRELEAYSHHPQPGAEREGQQVLLVYALDLATTLPVCCAACQGGMPDMRPVRLFLEERGIKRALLAAEGMISPNMCVMISQDLGARARIGYVRPLSLADPRLADNGLFNFRKPLHAGCDTVLYNQATLPGRIRLYAFKDTARAKLERENYVSLAMYNRDFDRTVYAEQEAFFGVTAFECDTDLDAETVFAWSRNRQTMAMVLRRFTNRDFLELDGPKRAARQGKRRRGRPPQAARATGPAELVDEEYDEEDLAADRVRGLEFVNFLAARAVCCMMFRASAAGLLEKRSWGELMDDLATSWRMSDDTGELPVLGDKGWAHTLPPVLDLIERLGLAALSEEDLPKKRGRPRTRPPRRKKLSPGAQAAADAEAKAAAADALAAARDALWAGPKAQEMAEARAAARAAAREGRNAQDAKDARDLKEAKDPKDAKVAKDAKSGRKGAQEESADPPRKRGRPAGSKNRPKPGQPEKPEKPAEPPKRRGRPSKSKIDPERLAAILERMRSRRRKGRAASQGSSQAAPDAQDGKPSEVTPGASSPASAASPGEAPASLPSEAPSGLPGARSGEQAAGQAVEQAPGQDTAAGAEEQAPRRRRSPKTEG